MALSMADLPSVFSLLSNALSADPNVRKPAEATLSEFESRPGFCSSLLEIITSETLAAHTEVRLLATVYLKNSVNRYWRHRRDSYGISNEEKAYLRKKLLTDLRETNYQSADVLISHRVYMVLFCALKELSTKRLSVDQRSFSEICSHFLEYSWGLWQRDFQTIFHRLSSLPQSSFVAAAVEGQDDLQLICERWLLCLKIIRQMILFGFPSDAKSVQEGNHEHLQFIKKSCYKMMKVLVLIQNTHPYSFSEEQVLSPILEFCLNKIINPEPVLLASEHFLIQCMVMVMSVVDCIHYKPIITGSVINGSVASVEERKKNLAKVVDVILKSVLTGDRIVFLCNILVRRYFLLSANDLEEWNRDPEVFHHEQDLMQTTDKLRPCAEALFIIFFENHAGVLGPFVVSILHEAMSGCSSTGSEITPALLLKEAAYGSAGYTYYELSKYLNFKAWYEGALALELSNNHPNQRIIHRKVAWILGKWVSEIKDGLRKPVSYALMNLLQGGDLAVKLAAVRALYCLIEDDNFYELDPSDYFPICWKLCFKLFEDVQIFESKVAVLNLISLIIERLGDRVIPFANELAIFFRKLWDESAGESLLQVQLLVALKNLIVSLGPRSPMCYSVVLPILRFGIDIANPDELSFLEDSVLLWEATLTQAPSMVPQLLDLFPYLVAIMERSFDHLQVAMNITECYLVLGGLEFLNVHAENLVKLLHGTVNNVSDKGMPPVLQTIETLIKCFPKDAPPLINSVLQNLTLMCLSGADDSNPSKAAVKASAGSILARIMVVNTNYLVHLVSEPSFSTILQQVGVSLDQNILLSLVDVWLEKVDNIPFIQRKTCALALAVSLKFRETQILEKLEQIVSVCTSVIVDDDEAKDESSFAEADSIGAQNNLDSFGTGSTIEMRKRQIKESDPIKQLALENILKENLHACAAIHGESNFNSAMGRIHPSVLSQLQQALKMA
ncbi:Importin-11 [Nymphaea thermarum]|nr:Importin-11 [Nymphaea thermarum]